MPTATKKLMMNEWRFCFGSNDAVYVGWSEAAYFAGAIVISDEQFGQPMPIHVWLPGGQEEMAIVQSRGGAQDADQDENRAVQNQRLA
jgi:hypothetical protein